MTNDYQQILNEIYQELRALPPEGKVANYIPELARVDPEKFGISLRLMDGRSYQVGDAEEKFSIQSISKVFAIAMAVRLIGAKVWERVGVEPSGDPFNSLVQLEYEAGIPRNPFINSGALVVTDVLISELKNPKEEVLAFINDLLEGEIIGYDESVAASEKAIGFRNVALTNFMKSFGNIKNEVEEVVDLYFHMCAIAMSCTQLTKAFLLFANHGRKLHCQDCFITESQTKRLNAIMLTCGFYDEAGDFAFKVGLPGKSGVGGGIAAILPMRHSITVWSPRLNEKGNSALGLKALELFTTRTGLSIF